MTAFTPKEKLTAYQRWELAAFDEAEQAAKAAEQTTAEQLAPAPEECLPQEPPVKLPTAEEVERIHSEAHDSGYAAGYAAGYEEGIAEARAAAARIDTVMTELQQSLRGIDQNIADQLLAVAIEVASQVLRQSLRVKPELLLPVVREAVASLYQGHGHPALFVHPADASLIRTHLGEQLAHNNWRIIEDALLMPGGCRVELGASEVDATMETRWRRVIEAIGITQEWLSRDADRS